MAKKKKKPRLRVTKEARRRARLGIGLPPAERTIPDKREKPGKHKDTLGDLLLTECAAIGSATFTAVTGFLECLRVTALRLSSQVRPANTIHPAAYFLMRRCSFEI
jgi:hypothetical protein